jgi:hypothetical protein
MEEVESMLEPQAWTEKIVDSDDEDEQEETIEKEFENCKRITSPETLVLKKALKKGLLKYLFECTNKQWGIATPTEESCK